MKYLPLYLLLIGCLTTFSGLAQNEKETPRVEVEIDAPPPVPAPQSEPFNPIPPKRAYRGKRQGRYGFYTSTEWIIPSIYDELPKKYSDFMIAKKDKKYGVIDRLNREVLAFEYNKIAPIYINYSEKKTTGYLYIEKGKLKGIIDGKGKIIVPVIYPYLQTMKNDGYIVGTAEGTYGILSVDGKEMHPVTLEGEAAPGIGNSFIFKKNGKYGTIDPKGKTVIPFKYEAMKFNTSYDGKTGNLYVVKLNGKVGAINKQEKVIVPFEYDDIRPTLYKQMLSVKKGTKYGILDRKGKVLVPVRYESVKQYPNQFYIVKNNDLAGLMNPKGEEITKIEYETIERKSLRYFEARKDWNRGVIDSLGNVVLDFQFRRIQYSNGELIFAAKHGEALMGLYDGKGNQIKEASYFKADRAYHYTVVQKTQGGKYALFDNKSRRELTPFQYDRIKVRKDRKDDSKLVITGFQGSVKVQLDEQGQEIGKPSISRAAVKKKIEEEKITQLNTQLRGSRWINIITINGKQHLQELLFHNSTDGVRKVYFEADKGGCFVQQTFKLISPDLPSSYLKMVTYPINACTSKAPEGFLKGSEIMGLNTLNVFFDYDKNVKIRQFEKIENKLNFTDLSTLKKYKQLKIAAAKLVEKMESRPGGLNNPYLSIHPETMEMTLHSYGSADNLAYLEFKGDQAVVKTKYWAKDISYSLSGIWRNVTYIDEKGQQKTGDLDICFLATNQQKFWLRPVQK